MDIPFIKIEGLGNDYIYVERASLGHNIDYRSLARSISDRHFGVGADGLIVMEKLGPGAASMVIYNSDGSEAKFCGNGLRGTSLYIKNVYKAKGTSFIVSTRWNDYEITLLKSNKGTARVSAFMGSPSFKPEAVGFRGAGHNCMGVRFRNGGRSDLLYCLAMPNPQAVIFVDNFDIDWKKGGATIEKSPLFKYGMNVMFTRVISRNRIEILPWERGSGATMACGSGAAAATIVSNLLELTKGKVTALMPGGTLITRWDIEGNKVYQEGPTRIAFSGIYNH